MNTLLQAILMAMIVVGSTNTSEVAPMTPPNSKRLSPECLLKLILNWIYRKHRQCIKSNNFWNFKYYTLKLVTQNVHFHDK